MNQTQFKLWPIYGLSTMAAAGLRLAEWLSINHGAQRACLSSHGGVRGRGGQGGVGEGREGAERGKGRQGGVWEGREGTGTGVRKEREGGVKGRDRGRGGQGRGSREG